VYHLARIIQFELFAYTVYLLSVSVLGKRTGVIAATLAFTATPPASIFGYRIYETMDNIGIPSWWMLHPFRRADMLPHHSASAILLVLEIHLLIKSLKTGSVRQMIAAGTCAFFSVIFHPVSALVYGVGQPLAAVIFTAIQFFRSKKISIRLVMPFAFPFLFASLAMLLVRNDVINTYPFNQWLNFDVLWYDRYATYARDYFLGGGALFLIGTPIALWMIVKNRDVRWVLLSGWALLSYLLMPISTRLGVAKFRFALLLPTIPLSIIIMQWMTEYVIYQKSRFMRVSIISILIILYLGITLPSLPVMYRAWDKQMGAVEPGMSVSYDMDKALTFLRTSVPRYSHILSGEISGIVIPAYVPAVVYVGQYMGTVDFETKKANVRYFYGGFMSRDEAKKLLNDNKINYIVYGPEEKSWGPNPTLYNIPLYLRFHNQSVDIYEVPPK
jgi:hypothetical protein